MHFPSVFRLPYYRYQGTEEKGSTCLSLPSAFKQYVGIWTWPKKTVSRPYLSDVTSIFCSHGQTLHLNPKPHLYVNPESKDSTFIIKPHYFKLSKHVLFTSFLLPHLLCPQKWVFNPPLICKKQSMSKRKIRELHFKLLSLNFANREV